MCQARRCARGAVGRHGSQGRKSPRGIARPGFRLRTVSACSASRRPPTSLARCSWPAAPASQRSDKEVTGSSRQWLVSGWTRNVPTRLSRSRLAPCGWGTSKMIAIQHCLLGTAWLRWGELRASAWWWLRQWRVACPLSLLVMVEAANSMEHNVTGYVVDVEKPGSVRDAVMTLAIDEELRVKMGASGLQRCREYFSAPPAAASIMDLYELYC